MTALVTNMLIRYLVDDVPEQAEAARALNDELTPENPGFICREVVLEVAWVPERSYRFTGPRIAETLMNLTASDTLVVEHSDDVAAAAYRFRQRAVGFADLMYRVNYIWRASITLAGATTSPPDDSALHWSGSSAGRTPI